MSRTIRARRDPRHAFLKRSAQILSREASSTAAYLEAEYISLFLEQQVPVPLAQREDVCLACGWLRARSDNEIGLAPAGTSKRSIEMDDIFTCAKCYRENDLSLPAPEDAKTDNNKNVIRETDSLATGSNESKPLPYTSISAPAGATSTSKKRAKTRKHNTSLQALLDRSKSTNREAKQGPGLDFMDFMKAE